MAIVTDPGSQAAERADQLRLVGGRQTPGARRVIAGGGATRRAMPPAIVDARYRHAAAQVLCQAVAAEHVRCSRQHFPRRAFSRPSEGLRRACTGSWKVLQAWVGGSAG